MPKPRHIVRLSFSALTILSVAVGSGCAPGPNGVMRPTLPWTRNAPVSRPDSANPWGSPNDGLGSLPPPKSDSRWSYLNELMKRADQQELLAQRQRDELVRLRKQQRDQYDRDRQYVATQREKERAALTKKLEADRAEQIRIMEEKERQLAAREQQFRSRVDQLRGNASKLDSSNRDLHAELARSERERSVLQDQIELLQGQLADTTNQLSRTRAVSTETDRRLRALQASASRKRGNASIRANNSVSHPVTAVMVPGLDIRQDNDLVRISIPAERLFMAGTASLHQGSQPYMDQIAQILRENYPQHIAGIEAHTDHQSTSIRNTQWRNQHQLTAAQSMAVFEQLTTRNISPHQMFVLGHGGNHPLVSSGTTQGQSQNRRIEIVVYPELYGR